MSKHSPEPWRLRAGHPAGGWIDAPPQTGQTTEHWFSVCTTTYKPEGEQLANAERIVACVNACKGMNPEAVPLALEALAKWNAFLASLPGDTQLSYGAAIAMMQAKDATVAALAKAGV